MDATNFNKGVEPRLNHIPNINELLSSIRNNKCNYITALDISKAYFVCDWDPEQLGLMYVEHNGENYGFQRTPFGLADLPEHFVCLMNKIFEGLEEWVKIYFDDILIISETYEQHEKLVKEVLARCNKYFLPLNIEKSHFCRRQVKYLGYILNTLGVTADPEKVQSINEAPTPTTYVELASFLGMLNFNRRFIPNVSNITSELNKIAALQKDTSTKRFTHEMLTEVEKHTNICKKALASSIMLAHPPADLSQVQLSIFCDASEKGMGGVICYTDKEGLPIPFGLFSRTFNKSERNYSIPKKEFFAMVATCKYFECFLLQNKFKIFTDHIALTFLLSENSSLHRTFNGWLNDMSQFDYTIEHVAGIKNGFADYLSRYAHVNSKLNKEVDKWESTFSRDTDEMISYDADEILQGTERHEILCMLTEVIKGHTIRPSNQHILPDLEYLKPDQESRMELLDKYHAITHPSGDRLHDILADQGYWWETMRSDCHKTRNMCTTCHRFNDAKIYYKLEARSPLSLAPWTHVQMDLTGPKQISKGGNKYILILIDVFTGFIIVRPMPNKESGSVLSCLKEIFASFGSPAILQSDCGTEFTSKEMEKWLKEMRVTHNTSAPHNPSTNGKVERAVKTVSVLLNKKYHNSAKTDWEENLFQCVHGLNNTPTPRLNNFSPHFAFFMRRSAHFTNAEAEAISRKKNDPIVQQVEDWLILGESLRQDLDKLLIQHNRTIHDDYAKQHNTNTKKVVDKLQPGTVVYKKNFNKSDKSQPNWLGPYTITGHDQFDNHFLKFANGKDPDTIHPADKKAVPIDHLKVVNKNCLEPMEDVFIVNKIDDHYDVYVDGSWVRLYHVHWKGYRATTYEPASNISFGNKLQLYEEKLKPSHRFEVLFIDPKNPRRPKYSRTKQEARPCFIERQNKQKK